jgi:hypothetical protein
MDKTSNEDAIDNASSSQRKSSEANTNNPANETEDTENDLLQSHIVPPSHILPDGRFIRLPPPTEAECSSFFERAAASHHLISSDEAARKNKVEKKKAEAKPYVHPLAVASARLRGKGIDELSKAINLGGLVSGGEYFGLTNVVNRPTPKKKDDDENEEKDTIVEDEAMLLDRRLRSSYALKRYRNQYDDASSVLAQRSKRLLSSLSGRRVLDARLRSLRQRWRLAAPERRPGGMVRARDVVAVDVEVYDGNRGSDDGEVTHGHTLGRIARKVPRFATMELEEGYDVLTDVNKLREEVQNVWRELKGASKGKDDTNGEALGKPSAMEVDGDISKQPCKTKAEPFATADPTLGQIDPDFDPDKVPLLTLLFEIEKPSTGFVQRATLSSAFSSKNNQLISPPDERVIESLQHSLFCASLFESMRAEIIPPPTQSTTHTQQRNESVAWLSSEMEESFLPPPSLMAGRDSFQTGDARLLCVVHCHEGEVKVQLDDEYCLTAKLIEVGTTAAANDNNDGSTTLNDEGTDESNSGSESPARLQALCKALLLHSQSLYHEHRMKMGINKQKNNSDAPKPVGLARIQKEEKTPSPRILQSCVGLGCKFIFEKKVRAVLKVSVGINQSLFLFIFEIALTGFI